jgi:hypothetical protein
MSDNGVRLSVKNAEAFDAWFRTTGAGSGALDMAHQNMVEMTLRYAWDARREVPSATAYPFVFVAACPEVKDLLLSYARMCLGSYSDEAKAAHRAALSLLSQIHVTRMIGAAA